MQAGKAMTVIQEQRPWTADDVKARLAEAAETLRRLPFPKNGAPARLRIAWPEVVRNSFDDWWGLDMSARVQRAAPSPDAIRRMDEALGWLHWLSDDQRRIVWARACGMKWRRLEDISGRCDRTLRTWHAEALQVIANRLNGSMKISLPAFPEIRVG